MSLYPPPPPHPSQKTAESTVKRGVCMQRKYGRQEAKKGRKQMTQNVGRGGALREELNGPLSVHLGEKLGEREVFGLNCNPWARLEIKDQWGDRQRG